MGTEFVEVRAHSLAAEIMVATGPADSYRETTHCLALAPLRNLPCGRLLRIARLHPPDIE